MKKIIVAAILLLLGGCMLFAQESNVDREGWETGFALTEIAGDLVGWKTPDGVATWGVLNKEEIYFFVDVIRKKKTLRNAGNEELKTIRLLIVAKRLICQKS